jgi:L,D-transpeptidase ErfK/SrfK
MAPAAGDPLPAPPPRPSGAALLGSDPLVLRLNDHDWPRPDPHQTAPPIETPAPPSATPQARLQAAPVEPPPDRLLVLDRRRRVLKVFEQGRELRRFPVAVGMPGWETPVGRFKVIEKTANPVWEHPANGRRYPSGPDNPLGTRWIGFYRDCKGRSGFNGQEHLEVKGCVTAGFHGTPNRSSVGQAVSHGCVRLFDENARELFDLVRLGTPVDVLP